MKVRDLLAGAELRGLAGSPEMDPLTEKDALQEARLNEVVFDALNMRAGLLFDLRGALQLRTAYTGFSCCTACRISDGIATGGPLRAQHGMLSARRRSTRTELSTSTCSSSRTPR